MVNRGVQEWGHEVSQGQNFRCRFPILLLESLIHLFGYVSKMFEDPATAKEYLDQGHHYGFIISVICFIAPTAVFTLYETSRSFLAGNRARETMTRMLNGLLLIPWQIKAHVDHLSFAAKRACVFRRLYTEELQHLSRIKQEVFVLEFFVDFYSGFFQLLLQLHFLVISVAGDNSHGKPIICQIIASSWAVFSLIKAFQRKDDGILAKILSYIGWISFCASRVLAFALLSSVFRDGVLYALLIHALVATVFVFGIVKRARTWGFGPWKDNIVLVFLCFFQFGVPSLVYWPLMFQFKKRIFVAIFFAVSAAENLTCLSLWFMFDQEAYSQDLRKTFGIAILVLTFVAILSLSLYQCCKPDRTEMVALSNIQETNSNKYGIFFDFCNAVEILPDTFENDRRREQIRRLRPDL